MEEWGLKIIDTSMALFICATVIYVMYRTWTSQIAAKDAIIAAKDKEIAALQSESKEEIRQNRTVLIKAGEAIASVIDNAESLKSEMVGRLEELKELINKTITK